jgi:hypothetical protein
MIKLPKVQAHWGLVTSALNGALLGLMAAVTNSFVDAVYGDIPSKDVAVHMFTETALFVSAGAISFTLVSAIYSWLRRDS